MPCHHVTLATRSRLPLARGEAGRRRLVGRLARLGRRRLVVFSLADDHLHLVVAGSRSGAGRLARGLSQSLRREVGQSLAPAHIRRVDGRRLLRTLVDYMLQQVTRRGLDAATVSARRAAVAVADGAGLRTADVAAALRLTTAGSRNLRTRPPDPAAAQAVRVRLSLELTCFGPSTAAGDSPPARRNERPV